MSKTFTFAFSSRKSVEIIILFLFFTLYFHHVYSYNFCSSNEEKSFLLQLKKHWYNPSSLDGWNASTGHCTWPGIKCSIEGSVEGIEVTFGPVNIYQIIPPLICDLKNLISIDLSSHSYSYIYGQFPTSLCNCSKLKSLTLSGIEFDGGIPGNIDGLLSPNLEWLDLSANGFSGGIPATIGNLTDLQYLNLSQNGLTGKIPDGFWKLKRLSHLDLHRNLLSGQIPTQLAALPYLRYIDLGWNRLSGPIPSAIVRSSKLRWLDLSQNKFSSKIPSGIRNLSSLERLDLSFNYFSGPITTQWAALPYLSYMDLRWNQLSGPIPSSVLRSPGLAHMSLSNNEFSGEIPSEIWNLSRLEILDLSVNRFSGKILSGIGNSFGLRYLRLSHNKFSGKIPNEIGKLSLLEDLDISRNEFSGKIPSEIGNLWSLTLLDFSHNKFSGKIPSEIGNFSSLTHLDLSDNNFSGNIPPEFSFPNLYFVNLSSNRLCGSIPETLKNSSLRYSFLDISDTCKSNQPFAAIVLSIFAAAVLLVMAFTFYILWGCKFPRSRSDSTWKLIPFQKLDFTESTILSSLIERNLIGRGGSGNLYKIQANTSGEYVAVKRIYINEKMEERLEKQFLSELQILGTIRHLNILKLMCCFSSENTKLLVYEYMENGCLDEWLHGKRRPSTVSSSYTLHTNVLEWRKRLQIAIATAQGLCYMHHCFSSPIIHRDMKSSNILLDSEFNAKTADFGLARFLKNDGIPETMSVLVGTFGYIAPECAQTTRINEKVDVYSFGVILLELVTGRKAHQGDESSSLAEWAWHHIQHGNPIVDALDEDIKDPNYLDEVIKVFKLGIYCTHTIPSNRPTMREVQDILHLCAHPSAPGENILRRVAINSTQRQDRYIHWYLGLKIFNSSVDRSTN